MNRTDPINTVISVYNSITTPFIINVFEYIQYWYIVCIGLQYYIYV
jgi:hypothetical protein